MLPVGTMGVAPSASTTPRMETVSPFFEIAPTVLLQLNAPLIVRFLRKLNRSDVLLSAVVRYGLSRTAVIVGTSRLAPLIVIRIVRSVMALSVTLVSPRAV